MGDGFELPILVFFPVRHDRTPPYAKHMRLDGRWVAEISHVIVEVVHTDVVPAVVSEGADEVVVWAGRKDFGWYWKAGFFGGG